MNTIETVMEPWDASLVARELEKSLSNMKASLVAMARASGEVSLVSTPVMEHTFFVSGSELVCVPSEFVYQGHVDEALAMEACSPMELDLSVNAQKALIEAIDEWVSRPVIIEISNRTSTSAA